MKRLTARQEDVLVVLLHDGSLTYNSEYRFFTLKDNRNCRHLCYSSTVRVLLRKEYLTFNLRLEFELTDSGRDYLKNFGHASEGVHFKLQ